MITVLGSLLVSSVFSQAAPPSAPPAPAPPSRPVQTPPSPASDPVPIQGGGPSRPERATPPGLGGTPGRNAPGGMAAPTATPPAPPPAPSVGEDGMVDGPPPIQVDPPVLDFGFISPKSLSKGEFKLWNRGQQPITILAVQPSCKCTTTNDLADAVIKPGEFVALEASLDGAPLPGPRKANIKVLVDGYSRVLELELKGEVAYPLRAPPGYLNVVKGQEQKGRIVVESIDKKPFRICHVHGNPPEYIGFDPATDPPRANYVVRWDISKFGEKIPAYLLVVTDRPDCPVLPVRVRHETTIPKPIFRLKEYSVNLGQIEPGTPLETVLEMEDPGEAIIAVATEDDHVRAELVSTELVEGSLHAKVRFTARPGHDGMIYVPLTIYSGTKEMTIPAFGIIGLPGKTECGGA